MFRFGFGFGFNTGSRKVFGAFVRIIVSAIAELNPITRNVSVSSNVEVEAASTLTVIKYVEGESSVEVTGTATVYNPRLIWGQASGVAWGTPSGINWGE